jgi:hypothetical protein
MKFSRQFDQMDCGPACVRMVASYYGKDYPLSYLRSLAHLTREGVSVAGIRDSLTAIGMNSATFEMSLEQLYTDRPLPAILYWDQNHFVVLEKLKGRSAQKARYKIANPAFGKQWFSAEELCRHWSNGGRISCFILLAFLFLGHHIEAIYHVEHYVARLRVDPCFGATLGIHSVLHVADLLQDVYGIEAEGKITL